MNEKRAIIIGAGPAGLTTAYELLKRTDIKPIVYEAVGQVGGISKTVLYKGNRMDLGGHRFFSKSERVMDWWREILPLQGSPARDDIVLHRIVEISSEPGAPDPEATDRVMLIRNRLSRIFFLRRFFDYPISLNHRTVKNLGLGRIFRIACSYAKARMRPVREEKSLEDFLVNRFGRELYLTFFKDYTEKVWGVACDKIGSEWGAQRIKGVSVSKAIGHAVKSVFRRDASIGQKNMETSLIGRFMYPKLGAGQMWDEVAGRVRSRGGEIHLRHRVAGLELRDGRIVSAEIVDEDSGQTERGEADWFFSTMPVKELVEALGRVVPAEVRQAAEELVYRDFVSVGLLLRRLKIRNETKIATINDIVPDNWIYIQERDVRVGRVQIFNNWSPYMVKDAGTVWIGAEYFCSEGDDLWGRSDEDFAELAVEELARIGFVNKADVLDSVVVRMSRVYPAYWGGYEKLDVIRGFTDEIENLFLVGRNGMHKYNNQDHSMLAAMTAVDNIVNGVKTKDNIWAVNPEGQYHEEK